MRKPEGVHVKVGASLGFWGRCSVCAGVLAACGAQAESRFEVTASERVETKAHLDITIMIPHVVYLERPGEDAETGTTEVSLRVKSKDDWASDPFIAKSNAGTLAFSPLIKSRWQSAGAFARKDDRASASTSEPDSAYLVATP